MCLNDFDLSFVAEYEEDSDHYRIHVERSPDLWNPSFNWSVYRLTDNEEVSEGFEFTPGMALCAARKSAGQAFAQQ